MSINTNADIKLNREKKKHYDFGSVDLDNINNDIYDINSNGKQKTMRNMDS